MFELIVRILWLKDAPAIKLVSHGGVYFPTVCWFRDPVKYLSFEIVTRARILEVYKHSINLYNIVENVFNIL